MRRLVEQKQRILFLLSNQKLFNFYYFTLFSSLVTTHKNPEGTCVQNKVLFLKYSWRDEGKNVGQTCF